MKRFIWMAAILLAAMLSLSGCEKNPAGGNGDGNNTVAESLEFFSMVREQNGEFEKRNFTLDDKGRIIKSVIDRGEEASETEILEYGENTVRYIYRYQESDYSSEHIENYVMADGKAVSSSYAENDGRSGNLTYSYDSEGFLTGITHLMEEDALYPKTVVRFDWENGCLKSFTQDRMKDDKIMSRVKEILYYGEEVSNISNFNPFVIFIGALGNFEWTPGVLYNLFGEQSSFMPVKHEIYSAHSNDQNTGIADNTELELDMVISFVYEFNNEDKTVTKAIIKLDDKALQETEKFEYTFGY